MSRRPAGLALLTALAIALGGCDASEASSASGTPPVIEPAGVVGDLLSAEPVHLEEREGPDFLGRDADQLIQAITTRPIVGGRPTSGASISFFLDLEGPVDAAFKPMTNRGQRWYGEVIAYRLGRALGIDRIPPAATRSVRLPVLRALLDDTSEEARRRFDEEVVTSEGNLVRGAVMYWVPTIHRAEVDREDQLERWTGWLRQGRAIPPERLTLAQQLSEMIVFDYLTGNWDRWSGHNVLMGPDRRTLLIMDNNGAFNARFSERLRRHLELPFSQIERFSARLYERLRALDRASIEAVLQADPGVSHALSDEQVSAILARRDAIVQRIDGLVRRHGREAVLCFP